MFATIVGPYPRPSGLDDEGALRLALSDQLKAGLGILADGAPTPNPDSLGAWRRADEMARALATELELELEPRPVKARLLGPWTAGAGSSDPGQRRRQAMAVAAAGNDQLRALFAAGSPLVQVEEDGLAAIEADDEQAHALAIEALLALMDGVEGHVSLSISGGDASAAGPDVLYAAPFSSHLFDLILGTDGWRVARKAPRERGLILGVADCRKAIPDDVPVSVWAARYGASMGARGVDRIGLAPSVGLERLPLDAARSKLRALAEAAAVAGLPGPELRKAMPKRALVRTARPGMTPSTLPPEAKPKPEPRVGPDPIESA
jgi:methionine synthase II (cobalamin-independent)